MIWAVVVFTLVTLCYKWCVILLLFGCFLSVEELPCSKTNFSHRRQIKNLNLSLVESSSVVKRLGLDLWPQMFMPAGKWWKWIDSLKSHLFSSYSNKRVMVNHKCAVVLRYSVISQNYTAFSFYNYRSTLWVISTNAKQTIWQSTLPHSLLCWFTFLKNPCTWKGNPKKKKHVKAIMFFHDIYCYVLSLAY